MSDGQASSQEGAVQLPRKLLIIDDQRTDLVIHAARMRALGYEAKELHFETQTMRLGVVKKAAEEFKPDAVLTDWQLGNPRLTGELVTHMFGHEDAHFPEIPVVLHTSDPAGFDKNFSNGWKNSDECSHMLGVVEKGRHEEIHQLFSNYFRDHPPATGVSNANYTQCPKRGR